MNFKGTRANLVRSLKLIPLVLSGKYPDALGLGPLFWGYIGNAALAFLHTDYEARMRGGSALDGSAWAPLSDATLAKRRREGRGDGDILRESYALLESLKPGIEQFAAGVVGQVFDVEPGGVTVGSAVPYADFHQQGVPGRLPARPIVPVDGQIPQPWEGFIEASMEEAMLKVIEVVLQAGGIP